MDTMSEYKGANSVALLMHATLFSYQKSYDKMVGPASSAILRFAIPYLSEIIYLSGLPDIRKEKSLDDNISSYISLVKESGYVVDALFSQKDENTYVFEMRQCHFAYKGHRIFNEGGLICPFAILAATVLFMKTEKTITVEDTNFNETGSITKITVQ